MKSVAENFTDKIFNEDVLDVLARVPDNFVDMIYADPDYNVGIKYSGKSYTSKWDEYIEWYSRLASESHRVLKENGNMFFINYPKQNAHLRVKCLDDLAYDVQDYVWVYNTNVGHSKRRFTTAHRSVLHATKSKNNQWHKNQVAMPYKNPEDARIKQRIEQGHKGRMPYSWFYFDLVKNVSSQKTSHPCQIPQGLSELLIQASTQKEDTVFVLFGGSGSEVVKCRELGRHFITCELSEDYCQIIEQRLAAI